MMYSRLLASSRILAATLLCSCSAGVIADPPAGFHLLIQPTGPARPDPVPTYSLTQASFSVSLIKDERNNEEVGAGSDVVEQEYVIKMQGKKDDRSEIEFVRIGGHENDVSGTIAGFRMKLNGDRRTLILTRKGPTAQSAFVVDLGIAYATPGQKTVTMTGTVVFKGGIRATSPADPQKDKPAQVSLMAQQQQPPLNEIVKTQGGDDQKAKLEKNGAVDIVVNEDAKFKGTIVVKTNVTGTNSDNQDFKNLIELAFVTDDKNMNLKARLNNDWLQFVQVRRFKGKNELMGPFPIDRLNIPTVFLELGPDRWIVDTGSAANMFYGTSYLFQKNETTGAMFDSPGPVKLPEDDKEFYKEMFIFTAFFVYRERVFYSVHWERHFEFKDKKWEINYANISGKPVKRMQDVLPPAITTPNKLKSLWQTEEKGMLKNQLMLENVIKKEFR